MNKYLARFLLNYYVDMFDLLKRLNYHPKDVNNMFCPFHHNVHTPSAKMYKDEYGWVLWCFNEHRIYTTYDVYEILLGLDPMKAANVIWNRLTDEQKKFIVDLSGNQVEYEGDVPYLNELNEFSKGNISYKQLCDAIALKL